MQREESRATEHYLELELTIGTQNNNRSQNTATLPRARTYQRNVGTSSEPLPQKPRNETQNTAERELNHFLKAWYRCLRGKGRRGGLVCVCLGRERKRERKIVFV